MSPTGLERKKRRKRNLGLHGEGGRTLPRGGRGCLEEAPVPSSLLCGLRERPRPLHSSELHRWSPTEGVVVPEQPGMQMRGWGELPWGLCSTRLRASKDRVCARLWVREARSWEQVQPRETGGPCFKPHRRCRMRAASHSLAGAGGLEHTCGQWLGPAHPEALLPVWSLPQASPGDQSRPGKDPAGPEMRWSKTSPHSSSAPQGNPRLPAQPHLAMSPLVPGPLQLQDCARPLLGPFLGLFHGA